MRKKTGSVAMLCALTLALTACGTQKTPAEGGNSTTPAKPESQTEASAEAKPGEKVTISFSGHGDQAEIDVFNTLVKTFNENNPDITVKFTPVPSDYVGKTTTALQGGAGTDVFYVPDDMFGQWVDQGFLLNIQSYIDKSSLNIEDMWESAIMRYKYDGESIWNGDIYALPKDMGSTVLYYNKDLFLKEGVELPPTDRPMTWDEMLDRAKKLTKEVDGVKQYGIGPIWWEAFIWSNGGDILSEDLTTFVMNEDNAVEALQFISDLRNVHKVSPDSAATESMSDTQMFMTGRLGMIFGGRWNTPQYRTAPFEWDVCYIPTGKANIISGWSGTVGLAVNSKCANPEAAFRFIEYLASVEGQTAQTELGFALPIYKSLAESDVFLQSDKYPANASVFIGAAENQRPTPNTWLPNKKWWDTLNGKLGDVFNGEKAAKETMDAAKEQIDKDIKEGNPQLFQ